MLYNYLGNKASVSLFESDTVKKDLERDPQLPALEGNQDKWMLRDSAVSGFSHRAWWNGTKILQVAHSFSFFDSSLTEVCAA